MSVDWEEMGPFGTCREARMKALEVRGSTEGYLHQGQADELEKLKGSRHCLDKDKGQVFVWVGNNRQSNS